MAMVFALTGKAMALKLLTNSATPSKSDLKLKLYTACSTSGGVPSKDSVYTDFTEWTATGYTAATMTPASFTYSQVGSTAEYQAAHTIITFNVTTAGSPVYGYYVTDAAGTTLLGAEQFTGAPYTLGSSGGSISVTLTMSLT